MPHQVWVGGVPLPIGGAGEECSSAIALWRRCGLDVNILYFDRRNAAGQVVNGPCPSWHTIQKVTEAGAKFIEVKPGHLSEVPGLAGSLVVSFCSSPWVAAWPELHALGCRLAFVPTMSYIMPHEGPVWSKCPPTAIIFESTWQHNALRPDYEAWGVKDFAIIPGAFNPLEFQPRPREPNGPFWVGRLARPDRTKWSQHLWGFLNETRRRGVDTRAICMAWSDKLTEQCGEPPEWATCLGPNEIPADLFLAQCHALICPNRSVHENWPRVGMEAMSAGVPLIVDDSGGWPEMCGGAAIYCKTPGDYANAIEKLAKDEDYRQWMIEAGRDRVAEITDPNDIAFKWLELFERLDCLKDAADCPR